MRNSHPLERKIRAHIQKMDSATQSALMPFVSEPSSDAWVRDVLFAYFGYFLSLGDDNESNRQARKDLQTALRPLVAVGKRRSLDQMEKFLGDKFQRKGFFFLGGMTGPFYGPYIWKKSEKQIHRVKLPDRTIKVDVFFMHDFLIRSWMHFQTFGKTGTGGWVKRNEAGWDDGLYCVAEAYDLDHLADDLYFQVSLLKHEAQHFADNMDFLNLRGTDLEYRAKLVELIHFREMKYLFKYIIRDAKPIKADSHRHASYFILRAMSQRILDEPYVQDEKRWESVPYKKIQAEAKKLLEEHTRHLKVSPRNRKGVLN